MKKKSLVKNSVYNLLRTFVTLVFPLVIFMYASRMLGAEGVGKVEFGKNIVGYFVLLASLGINNYAIREGARVRESKENFSKFVHEILFINGISTLITLLLFVVVVQTVGPLKQYRDVLWVFGALIIFTPLGMEWIYGALEEYKYIAIRTVIFQVLALVILLLFVKDKEDYLWYAVVLIISSVGSNVMNLIHARKYVQIRFIGNYEIRKHLPAIFILFAMAVSNTLYSYVDTTMIGFINGDTEVGFYTAALKVNRVVVNVLGAVGAVVMPRLSYLWSKGDKDKFYEIAKLVVNVLLMFSVPACVGMCSLSRPILSMFCGVEFIEAELTMQILSLIVIVLSLSTFLNMHILVPLNQERKTFIAILGGLIVNISVNAWLIPQFARNGAAIGTILGELVVLALGICFVRQQIDLKNMFSGCYQYILAAIPVFLICRFAQDIFQNQVIQCCFAVIVSAIVYAGILILLKNQVVIYAKDLFIKRIKEKKQ